MDQWVQFEWYLEENGFEERNPQRLIEMFNLWKQFHYVPVSQLPADVAPSAPFIPMITVVPANAPEVNPLDTVAEVHVGPMIPINLDIESYRDSYNELRNEEDKKEEDNFGNWDTSYEEKEVGSEEEEEEFFGDDDPFSEDEEEEEVPDLPQHHLPLGIRVSDVEGLPHKYQEYVENHDLIFSDIHQDPSLYPRLLRIFVLPSLNYVMTHNSLSPVTDVPVYGTRQQATPPLTEADLHAEPEDFSDLKPVQRSLLEEFNAVAPPPVPPEEEDDLDPINNAGQNPAFRCLDPEDLEQPLSPPSNKKKEK